jgi:tetratricopeptide (TPR) repeat protein
LQSEGIEQLDRWLAANPKAEPALRAVALNDRCWLRAELHRDLNQALLDCDTALKLTPRNPAFLNSRGHVQLDRGQYDLAIADYDAALRENPKLAASLYGRGVAKLKKGVQREGEADLKAALALNPRLGQQAAAMGLPAPGELGLAAPSALAGQPEPADAPQS